MEHAQVNELINRRFPAWLRGGEADTRVQTVFEWRLLGLEAAAIAHLIDAVPVRASRRCGR